MKTDILEYVNESLRLMSARLAIIETKCDLTPATGFYTIQSTNKAT